MENISKLIPILYKKNEVNYDHNGLGKLKGLLVNKIEEVLNGEFEALFEYPANGRLADKIDNEMLIKAKPNRKDDAHVFKVYDYELDTFNHTYLIYARSKNLEDLRNNMVLDLSINNMTPAQAWDAASTNSVGTVNTAFYSDISTRSSAEWNRRTLLSVIAGQEESMVQHWGGEIKHDINRVSLYRRRGQDNVTTVRHGKNLNGLTAAYSTKGLITAIVPYYSRGTDEKGVYGITVHSKYANTYSATYYDVVEYNNEDLGFEREDEPDDGWSDHEIRTELNRVASEYFAENVGVDLPTVNMEIALEDISQTKEHEHFKDFEQIGLGDTITVYSEKYNLEITAKVRKVVYNGLTDKNEIVEIGTAKRTLYDDVRQTVDRASSDLQEGIDDALTSANGKNTNYYGTADPNEAGLVGQDGDLYFRTNGQKKEMWVYRDGMWHLEIGDMTSEEIKQTLEEAEQKIQDAREHTEAIEKDAQSILEGLGVPSTGEIHQELADSIHAEVGVRINRVTESTELYERVIGSSETSIKNNVARIVMADNIFQTQVSNEISGLSSSVSQLEGSWALRIKSDDDLVSAINASTKGVYVKGKDITFDGQVYSKGDFTITGEMISDTIRANKIYGGVLNAANMRVINLDAASISTGKLEGVEADIRTGYIGGWTIDDAGDSRGVMYGLIDGAYTTFKAHGDVALAVSSPDPLTTPGARLQIWHDGTIRFRNSTSARENGIRQLSANSVQVSSTEHVQLISGKDIRIRPDRDTVVHSHVRPQVDNSWSLGSASLRWARINLVQQPDVTSDVREKSFVQDIPRGLVASLKEIHPRMYWRDDQWHIGYIAQDVERAIYKYVTSMKKWNNLAEMNEYARSFAMLHKDESKLSLLYGEIAVAKDAEKDKRIDELEKRLEALESEKTTAHSN